MSTANPCCVCIGGVNYTISCKCNPCGGACGLAMSVSNPNPAVSQSPGGARGDGGASALSCILNSVGRWGSVLTAQAQGRPVAVSPGGGVSVGARGATNLPGNISGGGLLLFLIVAGAIVWLATR